MRRMIPIVDLKTGAVLPRASDTRTLDLPVDLDLEFAVASLDAGSHVLYRSTRGKEVSCLVHPRPLSWRARGEECLVAEDRKSTRLNSSHANISYAVFCLKKKKKSTA